MEWDSIVNLVAQKGLNGAVGIVGLWMLITSPHGQSGFLITPVVGASLAIWATVIEFLMWRSSTLTLERRITAAETDKKSAETRLGELTHALVDKLSK
jgi:hypothetical protein